MFNTILTRLKKDEKGQSVILVAILAVLLLGITAFTVDAGYLYLQKRNLQNVADAASLAGAGALLDGEDIYVEVKEYVEAHGFDENDIVNESEIKNISSSDTKVPVELRINRELFFAKVLGFQDSDVGSFAEAEIFKLPGFPAFVSFDEDDGDVRLSGNINIVMGNQLVVHSNKDITVDGNAVTIMTSPTGTYLDTLKDDHGLYVDTLQVSEPLVSPFANFNHGFVTNSDTLGTEINRLIDAGELHFAEGAAPTSFAYYEVSEIQFQGSNREATLEVPGGEPGVIYINGDIKSGTIPGNCILNIVTNNGLVIVNGEFITAGNQKLDLDGLLYATGDIDLRGVIYSLNGGLWSEGKVHLRGTPTTFTTFEGAEIQADPKIRLIR